MAGVAVGVGAGALGGVDVGAGGAATTGNSHSPSTITLRGRRVPIIVEPHRAITRRVTSAIT